MVSFFTILYIIKITDSFKANIAQTSHISISIYELTVKRTIHPNRCTRPIKLTNLFIIGFSIVLSPSIGFLKSFLNIISSTKHAVIPAKKVGITITLK